MNDYTKGESFTSPMRPPDFVAQVRYLTAEEGGRRTFVSSGYRPHMKLLDRSYVTSCHQTFRVVDRVNPGETVVADMRIIWVDALQHLLSPGVEFTLSEGARVVAHGSVVEVLNPRLDKEDANNAPLLPRRYIFFEEPRSDNEPSSGRATRLFQWAVGSILRSVIPMANPEQDGLYAKVRSWKIEYDLENNGAAREIGFDDKGKAIVAAPLRRDMGLWTDEDLTLEDYARFNSIVISQEEFEEDWQKFNH